MAEALVQEYEASSEFLVLKFSYSVRVSSITNDRFTLVDVSGATPVTIEDPFEEIDVVTDYSTVSRILTLYWNFGKIESNTDYELTIDGLLNLASEDVAEETIEFATSTIDTDQDDDGIDDSIDDHDGVIDTSTTISVDDFSIINDPFDNPISLVPGANSDFYVTDTDIDGEYYLETDHNDGRITVKFNVNPDSDFVTSDYFKAQRKPIQRVPVRWETLDAEVSLDDEKPWVYVDFPLATDTDYFEPNYKYRLIVSKDIANEEEI